EYDWVPRSVRAKATEVRRAESELQQELGRSPDVVELASALDVSPSAMRDLRAQLSRSVLEALDEPRVWIDDDLVSAPRLIDHADDRAELYEASERNEVMATAVNGMNDRQRLVVILYFYQGLTQREIGDVLGVTESRVCQMISRAVAQIRSAMSDAGHA